MTEEVILKCTDGNSVRLNLYAVFVLQIHSAKLAYCVLAGVQSEYSSIFVVMLWWTLLCGIGCCNWPKSWTFVCCDCCVLSGRGLCDELITCPEESYRLWRVVVCGLETSKEEAKAR